MGQLRSLAQAGLRRHARDHPVVHLAGWEPGSSFADEIEPHLWILGAWIPITWESWEHLWSFRNRFGLIDQRVHLNPVVSGPDPGVWPGIVSAWKPLGKSDGGWPPPLDPELF